MDTSVVLKSPVVCSWVVLAGQAALQYALICVLLAAVCTNVRNSCFLRCVYNKPHGLLPEKDVTLEYMKVHLTWYAGMILVHYCQ